MNKWLVLPAEERLLTIQQASIRGGVSPEAIEKDWWVTMTLKAIFNTAYGQHLLFKGGTSLSKSWGLIERFSEDIDLAISRDYLGFPGELTISKIKRLKRQSSEFTSTVFRDAVEAELIRLGIPAEMFTLISTPIPPLMKDTVDPQELVLIYPSLFHEQPYLLPRVKIEVSARSLKEPWEDRIVDSLMNEFLPNLKFTGESFKVNSISPQITFLEKLFLMHEEFTKPDDRIELLRKSRHYYDLERIMDSEYGIAAIRNQELYDHIISHRKLYIRNKHVNYDRHGAREIDFMPNAKWIAEMQEDFRLMEPMFYGNKTLSFDQLMGRMKELMIKVRAMDNKVNIASKFPKKILVPTGCDVVIRYSEPGYGYVLFEDGKGNSNKVAINHHDETYFIIDHNFYKDLHPVYLTIVSDPPDQRTAVVEFIKNLD